MRKFFKKEWTLKWYELDVTIIITILATMLLLTIWPKFLNGAMNIKWYAYTILIILFSLPVIRKGLRK